MLERAVSYAAKAHTGQKRKGTQMPYIVHPMEVASIVARLTDDQEIICAAMLHDCLEDCKQVTYEDLAERFGKRVADLVSGESEDKSKTWIQRKQAKMMYLKDEASEAEKMIALADKLSNIRSMHSDYMRIGDRLWERFNMADKRMQGYYYFGIAESLESLHDYVEYQEYCHLVREVFQDIFE